MDALQRELDQLLFALHDPRPHAREPRDRLSQAPIRFGHPRNRGHVPLGMVAFPRNAGNSVLEQELFEVLPRLAKGRERPWSASAVRRREEIILLQQVAQTFRKRMLNEAIWRTRRDVSDSGSVQAERVTILAPPFATPSLRPPDLARRNVDPPFCFCRQQGNVLSERNALRAGTQRSQPCHRSRPPEPEVSCLRFRGGCRNAVDFHARSRGWLFIAVAPSGRRLRGLRPINRHPPHLIPLCQYRVPWSFSTLLCLP
ncbi:hypothetical protein DFJ74DRAFT_136017 [Hyaloraphidium curvatum]|nr:hypothetical protein DFJ74DRAFT_136017 [Hyaloraphidium curvatum]